MKLRKNRGKIYYEEMNAHTHTHTHTHTRARACAHCEQLINYDSYSEWTETRQTFKAVLCDGLQHAEEVSPVFGKLLQVLVNHLQCTLKEGIHDGRNVVCCLGLSEGGREMDGLHKHVARDTQH